MAEDRVQRKLAAILAADVPAPAFMIENALRNDMAIVLRRLLAECMGASARR